MTDKTTPKKKITTKKKVATKKKATANTQQVTRPATTTADTRIVSILDEMRNDRLDRDKQLEKMVNEIRQGFETVQNDASQRETSHRQQLSELISGLDKAFTNTQNATEHREQRNDQVLSKLSESILLDHKLIQKQVIEQEVLQEKKFENQTLIQEQKLKTTRLIAIPGIAVAVFAVIYMFYTVNVMEKAMTSMSADMKEMKTSVAGITTTMTVMRGDTHAMAKNTKSMKGDLGHLTQDMNVMSRNVSPAMAGMRNMMPWSP